MSGKEELPIFKLNRDEKRVIIYPENDPLSLSFEQFIEWSNEVIKRIIKSHRG